MTVAVSVRQLRKAFGPVRALDGIDLDVREGEFFGLLGPNGAGKTTTIRMIMRITLPDSGRILLGGKDMDDELRERIGYLPDMFGHVAQMPQILAGFGMTDAVVTDLVWEDGKNVQTTEAWQLAGSDPKAVNTWEQPGNLAARQIEAPRVEGGKATLSVPALSFTAILTQVS